MAYPRVLDVYKFCSDQLKKSLDCGRELEAKVREEEDRIKLEGKVKEAEAVDKVVAGDEKDDGKQQNAEDLKKQQLVGQAAKMAQKAEEEK